jgi:5'-nucleotidase
MEATILGVPAIALSQVYDFFAGRQTIIWDCAESHGAAIVKKILDAGIPKNVLMNINFPNCQPGEVQGVAVTMQGRRSNDLMKIDTRRDGRGNPYHWISFQRGNYRPGPGTDLEAVEQNRISVTPLQLDLTDHPTVTSLAAAFEAST